MLTEKKKFIVGIAWGFGLFIIENMYFKIHPFHSVKHHIVVNSHKPIGATYLPVSVFLHRNLLTPLPPDDIRSICTPWLKEKFEPTGAVGGGWRGYETSAG
jgi:hypothetical protein